jgi:predicted RNA binding protein YcfA (HicA-like mRNA interferase family)
MKVRILKQLLKDAGFSFKRQGKGDHEIWGNEEGISFPVDGSDGMEIPIGTLRACLRMAGIKLERKSKN